MPVAAVPSTPEATAPAASFVSLRARLLALVYEALLLTALLLLATAVFVAVFGDSRTLPLRALLQLYLLGVAGGYFIWNWTGGRNTLPMRTWRMRLIDCSGNGPDLRRAAIRYLAAVAGIACFGVGVLWAFFDPDRQFLHDRIAGTRLAREVALPAS